jgi:GNAT superfamily N-acetyltransferase
MKTRRDIQNWWAVEAMIASYNHVYRVVYDTTYEDLGVIGVSAYGNAPIAEFQNEFSALDPDPKAVVEAVGMYPHEPGTEHILDVFHDAPSVPKVHAEFQALGYEPMRTGTLLGLQLDSTLRPNSYHVRQLNTLRDIELANQSLGDEGEHISPKTSRQDHIHTFVTDVNAQPVGWAQLVTVNQKMAYLNQLYVMKGHRRRQLGTSLVQRAQIEAAVVGMEYMAVVPSDMAIGMFERLGYKPLAYFTAFRPRDSKAT